MTRFEDLALSPALLRALAAAGFEEPKPIQIEALPPQLAGRDVIALAVTGSGKTAAFALPLIDRLTMEAPRPRPRSARALILAPTRELAVQIDGELKRFGGPMGLKTTLVLGGMSRAAQIRALRPGVDVVVATPGRLLDLMSEDHVRFDRLETLVLDEADRMLDMGFIRDIRKIAATTPATRRTALFSATMPSEIETLAREMLREPVLIETAPTGTTAVEIAQRVEHVEAGTKRRALARLLADPAMSRVIVFARTKRGADTVARNLEKDGYPASAIHGGKAQNARQRALEAFRRGTARVLVATDIAARGIDVEGVSHVVNFDLPDEPESYTHRVGRTGRNGASGAAVTLCEPAEREKLRAVEKLIRRAFLPSGELGDASPAPAPRRRVGPKPAPKSGPKPGPKGPRRDAKPAADAAPRADAPRRRRPRRRAA